MFTSLKKYRSLFLLAFAVFSSSVIGVEALKTAAHKDFWLDEVFEFDSTLKLSPKVTFVEGVDNEPNASPLYHAILRKVVQYSFNKEKETGQGWDWRLTARSVSAGSLVFFSFIAFFLALRIHPVFAFAIPILLTNYNFAIFYGAEARVYAMWIGASILLYVAALGFLLHPLSKKWGVLWLFSSTLITCVAITSPGQIFLVVACGVVVWWLAQRKKGTEKKQIPWSYFLFLFLSCVVSAGLFFKWNKQSTHLSLSNLTEPLSFYAGFFWKVAILPIGGPKVFIKLLLVLALFLAYGFTNLSQRKNKMYFITGLIGLSQLVLLAGTFSAQYLSGFFYAERHTIFSVAIRNFVFAVFCAWCADHLSALIFVIKRKFFNNSGFDMRVSFSKWSTLAAILVIFSIGFDWFRWSASSFFRSINELKSFYLPYCHGPALYEPPPIPAQNAEYVHNFNRINFARHHGQCVSWSLEKQGVRLVDYSPEWIYGPLER